MLSNLVLSLKLSMQCFARTKVSEAKLALAVCNFIFRCRWQSPNYMQWLPRRLDTICLHQYLMRCQRGCSKQTLSTSVMLWDIQDMKSALAQCCVCVYLERECAHIHLVIMATLGLCFIPTLKLASWSTVNNLVKACLYLSEVIYCLYVV